MGTMCVSINAQMDKEIICIYMYTGEYYSAIKMNEILPLVANWIDLEGLMLRELS